MCLLSAATRSTSAPVLNPAQVPVMMQADMPLPSPITPLALPRQASPQLDPKPAFSTSITAMASLQSNLSIPVNTQTSSASMLASQQSSSSTATAAVLASLRQQHGPAMQGGPVRGPQAEDRQQPGQEQQATATSRR